MNRTRAMAQRARELTVQLSLTPPFQPRVFVSRLAEVRGLAIKLVPFPMLGAANGFCLRVGETEYLVYYDPAASPKTLARIIFHEVAHIILGHVPISTSEQIAEMLATLVPTPARPALFRRPRYSLPCELDAEALAMALTALSFRSPTPARPIEPELPRDPGEAGERPSEVGEFYDELGL